MNLKVNYKSVNGVQKLETNFKDIKKAVETELEKHSMAVTESNIPSAKKVMANLNKVKTEIGNKYKKYIDELSSPINKLKAEKKEIENIITEGRTKIADAVSVFEQKRLESIKKKILSYLSDVCLEKGITWQTVSINDLIKLGAVTSTGKLAKGTKEAIDSRVSLIENEILKAKLEAEEKAKRDREIAAKAREEERARALERERMLLAKAEEEKQEAIKQAKVEVKKEVVKEKIPENMTVIEKVAPKKVDDKIVYTVLATFEVPVPKHITKEQIEKAVYKKLTEAGVTTLKTIEVM